jgi:hypothetical protein
MKSSVPVTGQAADALAHGSATSGILLGDRPGFGMAVPCRREPRSCRPIHTDVNRTACTADAASV